MHWKAGPGKKVAIISLGGLGHIGVKIAHALGAEVTVLSHSIQKQEEAKKMGADSFYAASDPNTFKKLRGYFDIIINTVSVELDSNKNLKLLALDGTMVIVGLPENETQIGAFSLVSREDFDAFFGSRVQEAVAAAGVEMQGPPDVKEFPVHEFWQP